MRSICAGPGQVVKSGDQIVLRKTVLEIALRETK